MNYNKVLVVSILLMLTTHFSVSAQETSEQPQQTSIQELMTPIKPADGRPYIFYSQADLDAAREKKIEGIKQDIRQNHTNTARVKAMRENLWRIENAIVQELPNQN